VITYLRQENGEHLENVVLMTSAETINVRHRVSEHLRVIATTEVVDEIAAAVSSACSEER
jgi:hypothetical protein